MNNLPIIEDPSKVDFNLTLGVFATLSAYCNKPNMTIYQAYNLLLEAANKENSFISLNEKAQPNGFVIWTRLPRLILKRLKEQGITTEEERTELLKYSDDKGEPVVLYMLSPFGDDANIIATWKATLAFQNQQCWSVTGTYLKNLKAERESL